jgi:serine protease Do
MEEIKLLQTIESYLDGTMLPQDIVMFEELRKNVAEIDQMVVEHNMFLHQMDNYNDRLDFKHNLNAIHLKLSNEGELNNNVTISTKVKIISFYNKYKKVAAIAAAVGGGIALFTSVLVSMLSPNFNGSQLQQLNNKIEDIKRSQQAQGTIINDVKNKLPERARYISGGSGFLIDAKGYILTNAHVLKGSGANVVDNNGKEYAATIVHINIQKDLAILKINDEDFTASKTLPYSIGKSNADLGEEIFTLGYPRNEIVYTQGSLSAKTGINGDTSSYQIQINANPGNSGGPILNKKGEVIGVLSTKQTHADGVAFAIKSKTICNLIDELKKTDTSFLKLKLPTQTLIADKSREQQVKKIQDCIFFVKAYGK